MGNHDSRTRSRRASKLASLIMCAGVVTAPAWGTFVNATSAVAESGSTPDCMLTDGQSCPPPPTAPGSSDSGTTGDAEGSGGDGGNSTMPTPWVADQYGYDGTSIAGWYFYKRLSGSPTEEEAHILAKNLVFAECWITWWTDDVLCKD